jgi:hypothetical protein
LNVKKIVSFYTKSQKVNEQMIKQKKCYKKWKNETYLFLSQLHLEKVERRSESRKKRMKEKNI